MAVTWERVVFDHSNYLMKITYDTKKTIIEFHHDIGGEEPGDVVVFGEGFSASGFSGVGFLATVPKKTVPRKTA